MKTKAKENLLSQLMTMRFMKFALCQKSLQVCTIWFQVVIYPCSLKDIFLLDLRGQKHEVEVTVKMGLEAKNYETVSF
jgi:hypothetical protein